MRQDTFIQDSLTEIVQSALIFTTRKNHTLNIGSINIIHLPARPKIGVKEVVGMRWDASDGITWGIHYERSDDGIVAKFVPYKVADIHYFPNKTT